jgi:hypothetical protein
MSNARNAVSAVAVVNFVAQSHKRSLGYKQCVLMLNCAATLPAGAHAGTGQDTLYTLVLCWSSA